MNKFEGYNIKLSEEDLRLLNWLSDEDSTTLEECTERFGDGVNQPLKRLLALNLIQESSYNYRVSVTMKGWAVIAEAER